MMQIVRQTRFAMVLLAIVAHSLPAIADGTMAQKTLTDADKARLAQYSAASASAIAEARERGSAADIKVLDTVLAGNPQTVLGVDLRGPYRCRTIKLGGNPALTIYGWFNCTIDEDGIGYRLVKTSGSQRFSGHFIDDSERRLIYYGAEHYAGEKSKPYGANADSNQVGYFLKTGPGQFRLDLPLPKYESKFDIIELQKR